MSIALNSAGMEKPQSVFGGPRDLTQAAFSGGIFHFTGTPACLDFCRNPLRHAQFPGASDFAPNVLTGETEAVADRNGVRRLFSANPHEQVFAAESRRFCVQGKIDDFTVRRVAEVILRVRHSQRQLADETLHRKGVHTLGARAIHRAGHHRWRGVSLRISRTTVRHTDLLVRPQALTRAPQLFYLAVFSGCEGKPAFVVAFTSASVLVFALSKVTRTCFFSNRTSTFETPGTFSRAFFTVIGHAGQVMPETFKVTVWGDAQAEASNTSEAITTASRILIVFITTLLGRDSIKELGNVRIYKRNEDER